MKAVRCAIYTRKSSEEGLEQDFNSLDAQHDACAAYILSQASEGWQQVSTRYDDGGLSGGTLERPALQRLLADVAQGQIDIIVVYKVDRLTRSLLDFAKLVEALEKGGTSFVSVTQSFNTTTSMGRLTLNMLLSFAQFEREVTAERIRDKIAASKAKGMWMGGTPPLGYRAKGRTLEIVEEHAALVRDIFARYLRLGNVRLLAEELHREGIGAPARLTAAGKEYGAGQLSRGQLYFLLRNPVYRGRIRHKEKDYPGTHPAIIDRDLWDQVQARLADNIQGERKGRAVKVSLLAGLVTDEKDRALVLSHACKGRQRYRYYVSRGAALQSAADTEPALRIPARDIEVLVVREVAAVIRDPLELCPKLGVPITATSLKQLPQKCDALAAAIQADPIIVLRPLLRQVQMLDEKVLINVSVAEIGNALGIEIPADSSEVVVIEAAVRRAYTGKAVKLVQDNGVAVTATPDLAMIRLVLRAREWWRRLEGGETDINRLAQEEGFNPSYMSRIVRLTFLSPKVVEGVLSGDVAAGVDCRRLLAPDGVALSWVDQERALLRGQR